MPLTPDRRIALAFIPAMYYAVPAHSSDIGGGYHECRREDVAAYVSGAKGQCYIYPANAAMTAPPDHIARIGEPLLAGEQIDCARSASLVITFCASRADSAVRSVRGRDPRYLVPNVPRRQRPDTTLAPALREARDAPPELQRLFAEGVDMTRRFRLPRMALKMNGAGNAYHRSLELAYRDRVNTATRRDPMAALRTLVMAVRRNRADAFEELSKNNGKYGHIEYLNDWRYSLFTFCAAPDGKISAPRQLQGIDLQSLTDARGEAVGANLYTLAARHSITSLESRWRWGDNPPVLVTSYFTKVGDQVCGVNQMIRSSDDALWLASTARRGDHP